MNILVWIGTLQVWKLFQRRLQLLKFHISFPPPNPEWNGIFREYSYHFRMWRFSKYYEQLKAEQDLSSLTYQDVFLRKHSHSSDLF